MFLLSWVNSTLILIPIAQHPQPYYPLPSTPPRPFYYKYLADFSLLGHLVYYNSIYSVCLVHNKYTESPSSYRPLHQPLPPLFPSVMRLTGSELKLVSMCHPALNVPEHWEMRTAVTCVENLVPCRRVVLPSLGVQALVHLHRCDHHDTKGAHHLQWGRRGGGLGHCRVTVSVCPSQSHHMYSERQVDASELGELQLRIVGLWRRVTRGNWGGHSPFSPLWWSSWPPHWRPPAGDRISCRTGWDRWLKNRKNEDIKCMYHPLILKTSLTWAVTTFADCWLLLFLKFIILNTISLSLTFWLFFPEVRFKVFWFHHLNCFFFVDNYIQWWLKMENDPS